VFLLVLENHSYSEIVGNRDAPFLNAAAKRDGLAANYSAITHPSEPNYLALVAGSTFGVTSDDVTHVRARSLADQVSVRSYQQHYGSPAYALKHDPFAVLGHRSEDWSRFAHDPLAPFTLIVPDLTHDMHSGSVAAGDAFTRSAVAQIERRDRHALIFVTFDEGSSDNHVLTVVIGGRHAVSHRRYDHYALLHTIESYLGVSCLARACAAPVMSDLSPGVSAR
jgi:hypothetical protein